MTYRVPEVVGSGGVELKPGSSDRILKLPEKAARTHRNLQLGIIRDASANSAVNPEARKQHNILGSLGLEIESRRGRCAHPLKTANPARHFARSPSEALQAPHSKEPRRYDPPA